MAIIKLSPYILDSTLDFTFNNVTATGNIVSLNANLGNSVTGNYFIGNFYGTANLATYATTANAVSGSNVSGQVGNALVSGTVYTAAQPNITSVGTLTSLNVNGTLTAVAFTANTGVFTGNGNGLSSIVGANVTGQVGNALVSGTVYTAAQPNITSVGTLTGLTSNGIVNFTNSSNVSLGSVSNVKITGGTAGYVLQTNGSGTLTWADPTPTTTTYLANSLALTNGVYVSGALSDIRAFGDYAAGNVYVLTDGTGSAPAWIFTVDFINVVAFNRVVMNINYTISSGHTIYVQLYNTTNSTWDSIGTYTGLGNYYAFSLEVINKAAYINGSGVVQARLYHSNAGNSGHQTSIDYIALEQSTQGPQGPRGPTGATGSTGATGPGVATGGTSGQILIKNSSTDYDTAWSSNLTLAGNLSAGNVKTDNLLYANGTAWTMSGSPGGSNTYLQFNDGSTFGGNASLTFNKTTTTLTANNFVVTTTANLGATGNVKITGGSSGQYLKTDGAGNLSWSSVTATGGGASVTVSSTAPATPSQGDLWLDAESGDLNVYFGSAWGDVSPSASQLDIQVNNFTGDGVTSTFTLTVTPGGVNYTIVTIGGVVQPRNYYTITNAVINFGAAPASGVAIEVSIFGGGASPIGLAGSVTNGAQPNITSVGTLANLTATGNTVLTGNLTLNGSGVATTGKSIAMAIVFGF